MTYASMKDVKSGRFILIDGIPCRVVEIETSAPGKHGSAKMRVTAVGIFDGQKRTLLKPSSGDVEVPIIGKKRAQIVSVSGNSAQLMDLETYETFDMKIDDEFKDIKPGYEVELIVYGESKAISRVIGGQ
ncbi:MAG: translation initiation factor IF-5A [Candidatus Marsarchaeota archaeon]|nr:translation initiation factor IF-5A [Candidatus Marsarchaeota archaeon]